MFDLLQTRGVIAVDCHLTDVCIWVGLLALNSRWVESDQIVKLWHEPTNTYYPVRLPSNAYTPAYKIELERVYE